MNKDDNLVKSTREPMPDVSAVNRYKLDQAQAKSQRRQVESSPSINPAGKGQFKSEYAPFDKYSNHHTYAKPDPGHAAQRRGRKARSWADKARGK